eukprot:GABW01001437.1.p1 GENE.GABW01001437.1~~GABW01001437.1.p1  ORF type:complete len:151 (-),score=4.50 GABW01001437.1:3-455(-)
MRLCGTIINITSLLQVCTAANKVGNQCVLRFTPTFLQVIVMPVASVDLQLWAQLSSPNVFSNYACESMNNNIIALVVQSSVLHRAVRTFHHTPGVVLELISADNIVQLRLSSENKLVKSGIISVDQKVPVQLLTAEQNEEYSEPPFPHST